MTRDDLIGQLASCVGQGMRVPDEAFRLAASIDLERFKGLSVHSAALLVVRMGLQKRFRFFTVRPSTVERAASQLFLEADKAESKLSPKQALGFSPAMWRRSGIRKSAPETCRPTSAGVFYDAFVSVYSPWSISA